MSVEFVLVLAFMKDLLKIMKPATKSLQTRENGYNVSMSLIGAVLTNIILKQQSFTESVIAQNWAIRNRRQSTMLNNSAIEQTLGEQSELTVKLKSAFYETIDIVTIEMTNPFEKNDGILTSEKIDFSKLLFQMKLNSK